MSMHRIGSESLLVLAARAGVTGLNLVFGVIVARALGPSGWGTFELLVLFPIMLVSITGAGLRPALTYFLSRHDWDRAAVLAEGLRLGGRSLIIVTLLAVAVVPAVALVVFDTGVPWEPLVVAILSFPTAVVSVSAVAIAAGLRNFRLSSGLEMVRAALRVTVVAGTLLTYPTPTSAIVAYTLGELAVAGVSIAAIRNTTALPRHIDRRAVLSTRLRRYARGGYLANIVGILTYRIDIFIVGALLPASEVGLYAAAVAVAERLWLPSQAAASVLLPSMASASPIIRRRQTELTGRVIFAVTLLGSAVVWFAARPIIEVLYSSSFLPSVGALRWLLPGIVSLAVARILSARIAAEGRPTTNSYIGAVGLVTNIGLNVLLIPPFGIEGAAAASSVSYTLNLILRAETMRRSSGLRILRLLRLPTLQDVKTLISTDRSRAGGSHHET